MHYILIIGIISLPFSTYEDCLVEQAIRGGVCIEKSYGTSQTPEQAQKSVDRYLDLPLLTNENLRQPSKAFIDGFKEEMAKPEVIEEDI